MDVEKTIEFILSHQASAEVQMEKIREAQAAQAEAQAKGHEQHDREMAKIGARLDRAVRLSLRDARQERKRRQEMAEAWDQKITQLAAAQLVTEEKIQVTEEKWRELGENLKRFLDGLQRGTNGHS